MLPVNGAAAIREFPPRPEQIFHMAPGSWVGGGGEHFVMKFLNYGPAHLRDKQDNGVVRHSECKGQRVVCIARGKVAQSYGELEPWLQGRASTMALVDLGPHSAAQFPKHVRFHAGECMKVAAGLAHQLSHQVFVLTMQGMPQDPGLDPELSFPLGSSAAKVLFSCHESYDNVGIVVARNCEVFLEELTPWCCLDLGSTWLVLAGQH